MTLTYERGRLALFLAACSAAWSLALTGCGDAAPGELSHSHADENDHADGHAPLGEAGESDPSGHADSHTDIALTDAERDALGVVLGAVSRGPVDGWVELPGEVRFDENRIALVSAPVEGVIRDVFASVGDQVRQGDVLAVLDSRELAEAKAAYLSTLASLELVRPEFERERELFDRGVSTESRFQTARRALEEARIAVRSAQYQLDALGVDETARDALADPETGALSRYALIAPMDGVITERHAVRGEFAEAGDVEPTFVIADSRQVWVDAAIYGPDMLRVRQGARARIRLADAEQIASVVSFVAPQIGEATRTGLARLIVDNADGRLMPGAFVTVELEDAAAAQSLRAPASAIQMLEGETVVFVPEGDRFEARPVRLGRRGPDYVEIVSGLALGDALVVEGAFALKAELQKGEFGDGHAH
ncbi:efflux RND transporter periplasmic adaptor subunit [Oceanicaulis alexandrii]|uniref:efflux RND transporter periplasmic adaptor subunit n=1 Tax=Oceanicaulis alexandrii TaxID=153233 RepID=UPI0003B5836F|nr:efflux RND transporter periplasmic adaptor subunit [Oceanicaulis alexandrii]